MEGVTFDATEHRIDIGSYSHSEEPGMYQRMSFSRLHLFFVFPHKLPQQKSFQSAELKTDPLFTLKAFLFSHHPSEYAFAIKKGKGIIDITSDATGDPTDEDRARLCMYGTFKSFALVVDCCLCVPSWPVR